MIREQWRERLLNYLATANSRQGRREYRFGGQVSVEIRPAPEVEPGQLRILSRWQPDPPASAPPVALPACLELLPSGRPWPLRAGLVTIGREPVCDIFLDLPRVQELKLISGQHAYLQCLPGSYRLFDGAPNGLPRSTAPSSTASACRPAASCCRTATFSSWRPCGHSRPAWIRQAWRRCVSAQCA